MQDKEEVKKREERFMKKGLFSRGLFFTMMLVFVLVLAACSEKEAATPAQLPTQKREKRRKNLLMKRAFTPLKTSTMSKRMRVLRSRVDRLHSDLYRILLLKVH